MSRLALAGIAGLVLLQALLIAQTSGGGTPAPLRRGFEKFAVEGQPVDRRPPELRTNRPVFPRQTRAPYRRTADVTVTTIASGLDGPWAVARLPSGRFLVTEKEGRLRILDRDGASLHIITAGLPPIHVRGPAGLLDVVLDRGFASNRRIFFSYMRAVDAASSAIAVASATLQEEAGTLENVRTIFQAAPFDKNVVNNAGSRIAVDPRDGTLFVSIGDRSIGDPVHDVAQRRDTHLGKILHITAEREPAPGNPALGMPEVWSMGHRSPQGLAFAPDGRLWETEHGPRGGDELNLLEKGRNYGWPVIVHGINYPGTLIGEGIVEREGLEQPRYYWDPVIAPSGLAFYRGTLFPQWTTSALVGALGGQALFRLELGRDDTVVHEEALLTDLDARIRDVRVFDDGAVYVLTDGAAGRLLKLTPRR